MNQPYPTLGRLQEGLGALVLVLAGLAAGVWLAAGDAPSDPPNAGAAASPVSDGPDASADQTRWTCSMHPQIVLPDPGRCPICEMDLIPLEPGSGDSETPAVTLSPGARARAQVRTARVERRAADVHVRLVGKVAYDETRVARISAWLGGRIERAFVDFVGTRVEKGDHLLSVYSPELLVAQQELIEAVSERRRAPAGPMRDAAAATERAIRDRLRLAGLLDWQIRQIAKRRKPLETITIYAPRGGIVTEKHALQGAWVETGTPLYTIADLSRVWVILDAWERDLPWLRYGLEVAIEADAFPGESIAGRISFVSPSMDATRRTVSVRVDVANADLRLKPGMFVRATARVPVTGEGAAALPGMAGRFVCPMHPGEVADGPERCPICGMKLVRAEDHWLVGPAVETAAGLARPPLVIPRTAALWTGARAIVFVATAGEDGAVTYTPRRVELGPTAGDLQLVRRGLREGDEVVIDGAYRLDASLQIRGLPSMMAAKAQNDGHGHGHGHGDEDGAHDARLKAAPRPLQLKPPAAQALTKLWPSLAKLSTALAADDLKASVAAAPPAAKHAEALAAQLPDDERGALVRGARDARAADALDALREAHRTLNEAAIGLLDRTGAALPDGLALVRCPMAFEGVGAPWVQDDQDVANPYYGATMLRCGGKVDSAAEALGRSDEAAP